ncbi:MAG: aminoacyl-tRNA hydrolase [Deltaproteobacteria bacterium]|nr:aminoacyl-tRNA hydrolase [Deltaproteobacteria bacterium]
MFAIIGLGNPGQKYQNTRHNVGFAVVDMFCANSGLLDKFQEKFGCLYLKVNIVGQTGILVKPQKFMNLSGQAVQPLLNFFKVQAAEVIVVHDDLDLALGQLRVRKGGSSGGHKGVQDLINILGSNDFCRVRVGVGKPDKQEMDTVSWVLSSFQVEEQVKIREAIEKASQAIKMLLAEGVEQTQRQFN